MPLKNQNKQPSKLNESLRHGDLKDCISNVFSVDRFQSKMGEDKDIIVLGFRVKEKYPAIDLMEFIEKGYPFILDADMSTGEEPDGQYQVFVEMERNHSFPGHLKTLLRGLTQLTTTEDWSYRYQKSTEDVEFDLTTITEHVPTTPEEYQSKILEFKTQDVQEFFDQGSIDVTLESDNTITFSKPYSGNVDATLVAIGNYEDVKETVPGPLALDETSNSHVTFLNKYLGNYDINKVGDKFLIRNGTRAVVIQKNRW